MVICPGLWVGENVSAYIGAKNCLMLFVSSIGMDASIANMVKVAERVKALWTWHAKQMRFDETAWVLEGC